LIVVQRIKSFSSIIAMAIYINVADLCLKIKKGKGIWEYKTPYWAQIPLKFVTEWTRDSVE